MLGVLKGSWPDGKGVQEFVRILMLHERYPAEDLKQAIERALSYSCVHLDESCTAFMKWRAKPHKLLLLIRSHWISPIAPIWMRLAPSPSILLAMNNC